MFKKIVIVATAIVLLTGCERAAQVASRNLSEAADNFEIDRQIVFYNGITGGYMLTIQGRCSIADEGTQLEVTCKIGPNAYKKHFLGLSDNVTYFAQQLRIADVSEFHHRVMFRPQTVVPDFDFQGDAQELMNPSNTDG